MSPVARVAAQAKVNLLLRVLAREESGYHSIETIFQRLDLADDVVVRAGEGVRGRALECVGEGVDVSALGLVEHNLAYRAAVAYAEATGWPPAFAIELTKRIPVGGGLGGGSADAGAVLRALDALSPRPLGGRLMGIASVLGSDVPFVTLDSPVALGWGRGERLLELPVLAVRPVVLVVPPFGVATRDAYAWLAAERGGYVTRAGVVRLDGMDSWSGIAAIACNDFEAPVARRHPELGRYLDTLRDAGALCALLSGSGSTVFGVFEDDASARGAAGRIGAADGETARVVFARTAERVARVERLDGLTATGRTVNVSSR